MTQEQYRKIMIEAVNQGMRSVPLYDWPYAFQNLRKWLS